MLSAGEDVSAYTDFADYENFAHIENIETAILAKLRTMSKSEFERLPNGTGGMDSRIYKAVRTAVSLPQLLLMIKSKNFTMARIRRLVLCAFLGITGNELKNPPAYARILGMNSKGREILAAGEHKLPVDTSLSALAKQVRKRSVLQDLKKEREICTHWRLIKNSRAVPNLLQSRL